jgi:hypothetical protein
VALNLSVVRRENAKRKSKHFFQFTALKQIFYILKDDISNAVLELFMPFQCKIANNFTTNFW